MDEIKEIIEAAHEIIAEADTLGCVYDCDMGPLRTALARLEAREVELTKDRDYWQALAMQFHDAVHAEIERRAKVEI